MKIVPLRAKFSVSLKLKFMRRNNNIRVQHLFIVAQIKFNLIANYVSTCVKNLLCLPQRAISPAVRYCIGGGGAGDAAASGSDFNFQKVLQKFVFNNKICQNKL